MFPFFGMGNLLNYDIKYSLNSFQFVARLEHLIREWGLNDTEPAKNARNTKNRNCETKHPVEGSPTSR